MMKRVLSVVLALFMIVPATALIANAEEEPCFELTTVYGNPGDDVQVEVNICNNPGITALSVTVQYSSKDIELISVENAGLFEDAISTGTDGSNPIAISWFASDSENKQVNGTLAKLNFRILDNASDSEVLISYDPENVFNSSFDNQKFGIVNGAVKIGEEPAEPVALLGDVDSDDAITIIDATCIQRHLASIPTFAYNEDAADTDLDRSISIIDATYIQRWLASLPTNDNIGKPISK